MSHTFHSISSSILCLSSPVQGVEGFFAALHVALKRLLLGVNAHVDLEAVRGEEGLPAALLVAHERVLAPVGLLVGAQVPRRAVGPRAALEHALVALHLMGATDTGGRIKRLEWQPVHCPKSWQMNNMIILL